jgi:hypothetical protein
MAALCTLADLWCITAAARHHDGFQAAHGLEQLAQLGFGCILRQVLHSDA